VAEKLEKASRDGDSAISTMLEEFNSILNAQIAAIERALGTSITPTAEDNSSRPFDPAAASHEAARLRSLLEASDGDSEEAFRSLRSIFAGRIDKARLDALSSDISDFDFTAALQKLDDIVKECGLEREEAKL
jgi:hypothetical protein